MKKEKGFFSQQQISSPFHLEELMSITIHIIIVLISLNGNCPIVDPMVVHRKDTHTSQSLSKAYEFYELTFVNWHDGTSRTTYTDGTQTPITPNQLDMRRRQQGWSMVEVTI